MLEPRDFDVYMNATTLMVIMLDHSKVNTEVLYADIETVEFDDCREVSEDNRDINSVLAMMWEKARFFYKDR